MKTIQEQLIDNEQLKINLLKSINKARLSGSNSNWYCYSFEYMNKEIRFKAFKTWIQILKVHDLDNNGAIVPHTESMLSSGMDIKVSEFKEFFLNLFESIEYGNYNNTKDEK